MDEALPMPRKRWFARARRRLRALGLGFVCVAHLL